MKNRKLPIPNRLLKIHSLVTDRQTRRFIAVKVAQRFGASPFVAHLSSRLLMTPPNTKKSKEHIAFLKTGERHQVFFENKKIRAWSWGNGPLVLLVHGWGGYGAQLSRFVEPLVSSGHQVVLFDSYGHGSSEGKVSSVVHMAASLRAVVNYFNNDLKSVIAHSMGTSALLLYLELYSPDIESVVLISAPSEGPIAHSKTFAEKVGISEFIRARMQAQLEWQLDHPWETLEIPSLLRSVREIPTLLIHDENDRVVPIQNLDLIHEQLGHSESHRTRGFGHFKILDSGEVVEHVIAYLSKLGRNEAVLKTGP